MPRTSDPQVALRNAKLCEDYRNDPSRSYEELSRIHGMESCNIQKVLKQAELINRTIRTTKKPKLSQKKPISNFHAILGSEVNRHLNEKNLARNILESISESSVAIKIGISSVSLNLLKLGLLDVNITKLRKIAEWMEIPLSELISTTEKRLKLYEKRPSGTGP